VYQQGEGSRGDFLTILPHPKPPPLFGETDGNE